MADRLEPPRVGRVSVRLLRRLAVREGAAHSSDSAERLVAADDLDVAAGLAEGPFDEVGWRTRFRCARGVSRSRVPVTSVSAEALAVARPNVAGGRGLGDQPRAPIRGEYRSGRHKARPQTADQDDVCNTLRRTTGEGKHGLYVPRTG